MELSEGYLEILGSHCRFGGRHEILPYCTRRSKCRVRVANVFSFLGCFEAFDVFSARSLGCTNPAASFGVEYPCIFIFPTLRVNFVSFAGFSTAIVNLLSWNSPRYLISQGSVYTFSVRERTKKLCCIVCDWLSYLYDASHAHIMSCFVRVCWVIVPSHGRIANTLSVWPPLGYERTMTPLWNWRNKRNNRWCRWDSTFFVWSVFVLLSNNKRCNCTIVVAYRDHCNFYERTLCAKTFSILISCDQAFLWLLCVSVLFYKLRCHENLLQIFVQKNLELDHTQLTYEKQKEKLILCTWSFLQLIAISLKRVPHVSNR